MEVKNFQTDVLIVGSGGAGSRAAIAVDDAGLKATIVSKGLSFRSGCTGMAEGGATYATSRPIMVRNSDPAINGGQDILVVCGLATEGANITIHAYLRSLKCQKK